MNSEMIKKLLADWRDKHKAMYKKFLMFTGQDAEIFRREFIDKTKINHQLFNDFIGQIVGIKKGYFIGKPVSYSVDSRVPESERDMMSKSLDRFNRFNDIEVMDMDTAEMCGICGVAWRQLCNDSGEAALYNIKPWQIIPITTGLKKKLVGVLRYYKKAKIVRVDGKDKIVRLTAVEYYDEKSVTYFIQQVQDGKPVEIYALDPNHGKLTNHMPHFQDGVPFIRFSNNAHESGDGDKVYTLINAYNSALSDLSSEIEAYRLAYLLLYGLTATDEELERMKRTGAIEIDKDGKVEFVTKELDNEAVTELLDRLESNITKFSGSVDLNSKDFYGNLTRMAIHFKLLPLETKTMELQHHFTAALRKQYKLYEAFVSVGDKQFDYLMLVFTYHRSTPNHIKEDAEASVLLKKAGYSQQTIFEKGSVVEDAEKEMERVKKEEKERIEAVL